MTLLIQGLDVYAYHGVPEAERTVGHRLRLDLEAGLDERASETDAVEDTADYAAVASALASAVTSRQVRTLERLAALLADDLLARFPRLLWVQLTIVKPLPPAPVLAQALGVSIRRERQ